MVADKQDWDNAGTSTPLVDYVWRHLDDRYPKAYTIKEIADEILLGSSNDLSPTEMENTLLDYLNILVAIGDVEEREIDTPIGKRAHYRAVPNAR